MTPIIISAIITGLPVSLVLVGWAARRGDRGGDPRRLRRAIVGHLVFFAIAFSALLTCAVEAARANEPPSGPSAEAAPNSRGLSTGDGLALIGVALATGLSVLGAGYAVAVVGAAALGSITEKPELFGRTLVFIGLAEGLAIYGLIMSILMLGKLG
jgi:V/A-type H+-transporting ATPase subunit K